MNKKERVLISGCDEFNTQMLYFTSSSLSMDDNRIYLISDRDGNPNVWVKDLVSGQEQKLTSNTHGYLKSYVYFDGTFQKGLGKASVSLDSAQDIIYFIQDNDICKVGLDGTVSVLNQIPDGRMTAFTHVSNDGKYLCVPMTDGRCLDFDPDKEGSGLDKRPVFDIDERVQKESLNSYLNVYDTQTGALLYSKKIPKCWITHVQFNPVNPKQIMYNHEWSSFDCGIRRMWMYDADLDTVIRIRTEGPCETGQVRSREDWVCHEMWSDDGRYVIYHGAYQDGPAFVGRVEIATMRYLEIALPDDYDAYGHFTMAHDGRLVCDGYFKYPWEIKRVLDNSTDHGPDPHKKDAEYISVVEADWEQGNMKWIPLCKHDSDWMGQDAHPHAIYNHGGTNIYFASRIDGAVKVFGVNCE